MASMLQGQAVAAHRIDGEDRMNGTFSAISGQASRIDA